MSMAIFVLFDTHLLQVASCCCWTVAPNLLVYAEQVQGWNLEVG